MPVKVGDIAKKLAKSAKKEAEDVLAKASFKVVDAGTGIEKTFETKKKAENYIKRQADAIDRLVGSQYPPEWRMAQKKNYVLKMEPAVSEQAQEILSKIDTPEKVLALKGAEREQYLKALDSAYGDRATRAKDLGYNKEVFHGSGRGDLESLDSSKVHTGGSLNGIPNESPGTFTTLNPEFAGVFTDKNKGSIYKLKTNAKNVFDSNNPEHLDLLKQQLEKLPKNRWKFGDTPERIINDLKTKENTWHAMEDNNVLNSIKELGFEGYNTSEVGNKNTAIFDPKNIRSTNAAFDPRFKDSPYILSANSRAPTSSGSNAAQKVLDAARNAAQTPAQSGNQEASMFETVGRKALPYIAPALQKAAPVLEAASPVLNVLNKPQELATSAADRLTGGTGQAQSFADIGSRLNQKLPESMQNEGLMRDIGYAADIAFPAPKIDKLAKMANPSVQNIARKISKAALETGDASILNSAVKASANTVQKSLAGLDNAVSREIPMSRKTIATDRASHALLGPGNTIVLKGGEEVMPLMSGATVGKTVPVNNPGVKIIQGASTITPQGIKPASNSQSLSEVLKRQQAANILKGIK